MLMPNSDITGLRLVPKYDEDGAKELYTMSQIGGREIVGLVSWCQTHWCQIRIPEAGLVPERVIGDARQSILQANLYQGDPAMPDRKDKTGKNKQ